MKKFWFFLPLFFLLSCQIERHSEQVLPFHTQMEQGQLENGLRYFILPHQEPKNRIYLRLIVNAGSLHEEDDQKGVAHIVEHMAFNGTTRFPENQIIQALEQLGMTFARDINAFTDFENTVYTLDLSDNDEQKLALAFDVLNEWIQHVTILPNDLENERGIVLEEWRSRLSPMLRLGDQKSRIEMAGSRYILRDPIGDVDVIKHVSAQRVKDFYQKWYRPDNMSVVIVGDIDSAKVRSLLQQKLANIPRPQIPIETVDYGVPLVDEWRVASVSEPEIDYRTLEFSLNEKFIENNTLSHYRQQLILQVMGRLLNERFQEWERQHAELIDSATFHRTQLGREALQNRFTLQLANTNYEESLKKLFSFLSEIAQHGFSQEEFEAEIQRLHGFNQRKFELKERSLHIANHLLSVAVMALPVYLDKQQEYELTAKLLNNITKQEVEQQFKQLIALPSKLLLITQPHPSKDIAFSRQKVTALWQDIQQQNQPQWESKIAQATLPDMSLTQGYVVEKKDWEKEKVTEFTLSNGSRLIYMYSDKQPAQIYFKALTSGGIRTIPPQDYHQLRSAVSVLDQSGVGIYSQMQLNKMFGDSPLGISTVLDEYSQGFIGVSKAENLENLLKLFRLKLQSNQVDETVLAKYKKDTLEYLTRADREREFSQAIAALRQPNSETVYSHTPRHIQALNAQSILSSYQKYITHQTDFTYFIVGDIKLPELLPLVNTYLASVEHKKREQMPYFVYGKTPRQTLKMNGYTEPRAEVEIYLTADNVWQPKDEYLLDILGTMIEEKLRLELREKESGIYAISSQFYQEPELNQIEGRIRFSTSPERVDQLIDLVYRLFDDWSKQGVEEALLHKKREEKRLRIKQNKDSLVYLFDRLAYSYQYTHSPNLLFMDEQFVASVTKSELDPLVKKLMKNEVRFKAILVP
ncbi:M16 family metallopeptidase [Conservatibacter flavescens]|uniref:Peptidase M16 n=1 Tax=Conservatibacter flavescens TaxID=28161 RepID=A0A2M8S040_9PAST|nr:insulinase family protein [Conservatibacter flavescens]PJG84521.1 peptidase M16 [Conservatibacter flavescens]